MKPSFIKIISTIGLVISVGILPPVIYAQNIGNPDDFIDPDTPIDGGVGLLVAAGVVYGIKKFREQRKKSPDKLT